MRRFNLKIALILSLAVHAFLYFGSNLIKALSPASRPQDITIEILEPPTAAQLEAVAQLEKLAKKKLQIPKSQQIVDQNVQETKDAVNTRFLSEKNQIVEKQTVAAHRGDFQNSKNNKKAGTPDRGPKQETKTENSDSAPIKDFFAGYDPNEGFKREVEKNQPTPSGGDNGQQGAGDVSQTNDYIKDVDQGLETLLNTREFKYYSYYNRIRRQLAQHWQGEVRSRLSKLFKEGRAPAATNKDRITKVIVVLNEAGTLVRVQILADSGVRDLDEAAIDAFRAAAPFPNPPKGLIETDGTVKIRWDFILES